MIGVFAFTFDGGHSNVWLLTLGIFLMFLSQIVLISEQSRRIRDLQKVTVLLMILAMDLQGDLSKYEGDR